MPRTRKRATTEQRARLQSVIQIDAQGLEAFRATLPEYRRYEIYTFLTMSWDVVKAFYLIHIRPREAQTIDVALFAQNYGFSFIEEGTANEDAPKESAFFFIDTETVMSDQIDLERPVLIALMFMEGRERPGAVFIDGLHRLFKAARRGIPQLPAYILTPEEEQVCRA